jgi:hypothetical protein
VRDGLELGADHFRVMDDLGLAHRLFPISACTIVFSGEAGGCAARKSLSADRSSGFGSGMVVAAAIVTARLPTQ